MSNKIDDEAPSRKPSPFAKEILDIWKKKKEGSKDMETPEPVIPQDKTPRPK